MDDIDYQILQDLETEIGERIYEISGKNRNNTYLLNSNGNVISLSLSSLRLNNFPEIIFKFNFIRKIILEHITIEDKDWCDKDILTYNASKTMKVIFFFNIKFERIPKFIFSFTKLEMLSLIYNKLESP